MNFKEMMNVKTSDMNVGQTLIYTGIVCAICAVPYAVYSATNFVKDKIEEHKFKKMKEKEELDEE